MIVYECKCQVYEVAYNSKLNDIYEIQDNLHHHEQW